MFCSLWKKVRWHKLPKCSPRILQQPNLAANCRTYWALYEFIKNQKVHKSTIYTYAWFSYGKCL